MKRNNNFKIGKYFFNCSLCGNKSFSKIYGVSVFDVLICRNCGLVCLNPRMNEKGYMEGFIKNYHAGCFGDFLAEPVNVEKPYDGIEKRPEVMKVFSDLKEYLSPKSKILEIGCGFGENLVNFKNNNFNNLTGLEPAPDCCERIRKFYDIECFNKSLSEFAADSNGKRKFDCIILNYVIEHFVEPEKALEAISNLIEPEGIVYITTADLYKFPNPLSQFCIPHTFYFGRKTLEMLLANYGFGVKKYFEDLIPHDLALLAEKEQSISLPVYDNKEYKRVLLYLKKDKFAYFLMMARRFMEEFVIAAFGENVYLSTRRLFKNYLIKIIKKYKLLKQSWQRTINQK